MKNDFFNIIKFLTNIFFKSLKELFLNNYCFQLIKLHMFFYQNILFKQLSLELTPYLLSILNDNKITRSTEIYI